MVRFKGEKIYQKTTCLREHRPYLSLVPRERICIGQKGMYREKGCAQVKRTCTESKEIKVLNNLPKKMYKSFRPSVQVQNLPIQM